MISQINKKEERSKIFRGLELTFHNLLKFKKRMGSRLVISRNGEILKISVEEYMADYANEFNSGAQHKIESSKGD